MILAPTVPLFLFALFLSGSIALVMWCRTDGIDITREVLFFWVMLFLPILMVVYACGVAWGLV